MLNSEEVRQLTQFLNRLQNKDVRVEFSSRLNIGYRISYKMKVQPTARSYNFVSENGDISFFLDPDQAEAFSIDANSISMVYGDDLISIRYARTR